ELNLVDSIGDPLMRNSDVLDAIDDPAWASELGQFNLEINVPPRDLGGGVELEQEIRDRLNHAEELAHQVGGGLMLIGILPTLREYHISEDVMSAGERYKLLNEQIFTTRGEDMRIVIDGTERLAMYADCITPEAACTSAQLHVQVSPDGFASYWN